MATPAEIPSVLNVTRRQARKKHHCEECGRTIEPKETYVLLEGCWLGEWSTHKQCLPCNEAFYDAVAANDGYPEEGPAFGWLWVWWDEYNDERGMTKNERLAFRDKYLERKGNGTG